MALRCLTAASLVLRPAFANTVLGRQGQQKVLQRLSGRPTAVQVRERMHVQKRSRAGHSLVGLRAVVAVSGILGKLAATRGRAAVRRLIAVAVAGRRALESLALLLLWLRLLLLGIRHRRVRGLHGHVPLPFGRQRQLAKGLLHPDAAFGRGLRTTAMILGTFGLYEVDLFS